MTHWNGMESCFRLSSAASFDMLPIASSLDMPTPSAGSFDMPTAVTRTCQLSKAMQGCALGEAESACLRRAASTSSQQEEDTQPEAGTRPQPGINPPRRLNLDFCTQASLDLMGTQEHATPVELQFHFERDPKDGMDDDKTRSPAPSPDRKRPRQLAGSDSDSQSQPSQGPSQGRTPSGGAPGGGLLAAGMGGGGGSSKRPPVAPMMRMWPPALRNPYLRPEGPDPTHYMDKTPRADPRQSRYTWDFKQEAEIGHGKYGVVFRAVHRQQGKAYAIKRSKKPLRSVAQKNLWIAEIQAMSAVAGHPNVVTIHDSWCELEGGPQGGEHMFIKAELCGDNLAVLLQRSQQPPEEAGGPPRAPTGLPDAMLHDIFKQLCAALKHIHGLGLAHLDLKPDNIYTTPGGLYKLGDFGLATHRNGENSGSLEGDVRYLAPELLRGTVRDQLDKADMFALGVTMYELATGMELPTGGMVYQEMRKGVLPKLCPTVSIRLQDVIKRLMLSDPKLRPSAEDLCRSTLVRTHSLPLKSVTNMQPCSIT